MAKRFNLEWRPGRCLFVGEHSVHALAFFRFVGNGNGLSSAKSWSSRVATYPEKDWRLRLALPFAISSSSGPRLIEVLMTFRLIYYRIITDNSRPSIEKIPNKHGLFCKIAKNASRQKES